MLDRREFVRILTGITAGGWCAAQTAYGEDGAAKTRSDRLGQLLPERPLGSTGKKVTILCLGGWHTGNLPERDAQEVIETALEEGVRFFDNAEQYQNGGAETYYGKFLTPKYRDVSFIMTKTQAKDARRARQDLHDSLRRMDTDYLDLWQIHALDSSEDVDSRIAEGVLDVVLEAREEGKVRHIGFTGHKTYKAHLRMLEKTDQLQTCQMPMNVLDPSYESFIRNVLPKVVERKMGQLAMKTAAFGRIFDEKVVPERISIEQMHSFIWSLPMSSLVAGFNNRDQLLERIRLARDYRPLSEQQRQEIIAKVADLAGRKLETYKA